MNIDIYYDNQTNKTSKRLAANTISILWNTGLPTLAGILGTMYQPYWLLLLTPPAIINIRLYNQTNKQTKAKTWSSTQQT